MKIALISYEYPPDTAFGGIASYVGQAARVLAGRGHQVEVFAASPHRAGTESEEGILVHRITEENRFQFACGIGPVFARRQAAVRFDVLEAPEYFADAREAIGLVPTIPLVVKLHTPSFMIADASKVKSTLVRQGRAHLGALRRGINPFRGYSREADFEYLYTREADEVAAPCRAIGGKVTEAWGLDPARVSCVPYPYIPSRELLALPVQTRTDTVTFLGRLEVRKGVLDLAKAIPLILRRCPNARFQFVGRPLPSPDPRLDMHRYLERLLQPHSRSVLFVGPVGMDAIPSVLSNTDVCVFPSIWENFPNVCLEAMAAARGVVGSGAGGMAEMLDDGKVGRVIPPQEPKRIASAVIELLEDPALRMKLGEAARARVLSEYNAGRIGELQEASYSRAIERRRHLGARPLSPVAGATVQ